jgi:hypothetical protein
VPLIARNRTDARGFGRWGVRPARTRSRADADVESQLGRGRVARAACSQGRLGSSAWRSVQARLGLGSDVAAGRAAWVSGRGRCG